MESTVFPKNSYRQDLLDFLIDHLGSNHPDIKTVQLLIDDVYTEGYDLGWNEAEGEYAGR